MTISPQAPYPEPAEHPIRVGPCIQYSRGTTRNDRCSESATAILRQPLWWVDHASETFADGTPDPNELNAPCVHLEAHNPLGVYEAERYARAILAAVEEARS
jgi:hypothetical protein